MIHMKGLARDKKPRCDFPGPTIGKYKDFNWQTS